MSVASSAVLPDAHISDTMQSSSPLAAASTGLLMGKPSSQQSSQSSVVKPEKSEKERILEYLLSEGGGGVSGVAEEEDSLSLSHGTNQAFTKHLDNSMDEFFDDVDDRMEEFKQDALVKEAFEKNVNLREYAHNIEEKLKQIEEDYIQDYIRNAQPMVELHDQIQTCDTVLGSMENLLSGFQNDLGQLSAEIQSLQDQSLGMSLRFRNRLKVRQQLSLVLDGLLLPPDLIKTIVDGEINEDYMEKLHVLNKKMSFVKNNQGKHVRSFRDIGPEMERLRHRAAEKIRAFLLEKIKSLMAPNANLPIIQQSVLLKYKSLHYFLQARHSEAALEIRLNYDNIMSLYYLTKFTKYAGRMTKLQSVIADKYDMIGLDDSARKGLFGTSKVVVKDKSNVFTLGDRFQVLNQLDAPVLLPHVAEEQHQKFTFEVIYRSITRTLMDNASSEYCFALEFFRPPPKSRRQREKSGESASKDNNNGKVVAALEVFHEVFGKTLKMILENVKAYAENSYDAVGILLCIRITAHHHLIMQKRCIPCLDQFFNSLTMLLWPRFQAIMDLHINSVKKAIMAGGSSGFFAGGSVDIHPHYVTRRYAEFAASILALNAEYQDNHLETSLMRLRVEVESLIGRLAADFQDRKKKLIFLINNFDLIISILEKYEASSVMTEVDHFNQLLENRILEFVEEELRPRFGTLVAFVKDVEKMENLDQVDAGHFEQIAQEFSQTWRTSLGDINNSTLKSFTNFKNGTVVHHAVLKQLVYYYQTFLMLWEKRFPPNARLQVQPVLLQQLVLEIKSKYKSNF